MKHFDTIVKSFIILVAAVGLFFLALGVYNGTIDFSVDPNETINPAIWPEAAAAQSAQRSVELQKAMIEALTEQNRLLQESINRQNKQ